jgi:hypothetical protein
MNPFQLLSILSSTALFWLAQRTSFPSRFHTRGGWVAKGTKIVDSKRSVKRRAGQERASLAPETSTLGSWWRKPIDLGSTAAAIPWRSHGAYKSPRDSMSCLKGSVVSASVSGSN